MDCEIDVLDIGGEGIDFPREAAPCRSLSAGVCTCMAYREREWWLCDFDVETGIFAGESSH